MLSALLGLAKEYPEVVGDELDAAHEHQDPEEQDDL
jgi:hypothetical protein